MTPPRRPGAKFGALARVALATALVAGLLWYAGPATILDTIERADLSWLMSAFVAMVAYSSVKAWIWHRLLVGLGISRSGQFRGVVVCYCAGGFFGTILPSTAGTDAMRAVLAQRRFGGDMSSYAASVVVLNAISWLAACTMGLIAIAALSGDGIPRLGLIAAPLFAGVIGAIVVVHLLLKHRRDWWLLLLRRMPAALRRIRRPLRNFADRLLVFERAHVRFGPVFLMTLVAQLGVATTLLLTAAAVGIDLDVYFWLIYGPLVSTVALIPASVSGFGADQVAFVYLMGLVAVPEAQAFVASALFSILILAMNLGIGGLVFVSQPSGVEKTHA